VDFLGTHMTSLVLFFAKPVVTLYMPTPQEKETSVKINYLRNFAEINNAWQTTFLVPSNKILTFKI
jgi:hypothetical protein